MRGSCNHHFFQCKEMMCFGWWKFGCQKIWFEDMWQRSWIMNFMTSYSWKPGTSSTSSTVWRPRAPRKSDDSEANEHFETPAVQCTCFEAIVRLECWKLTWEVRKPLDMDARENYVSFACYFFQCFHWDISRSQTFNEICKADSSVLHSQRQKRNCFNLLHAAVRTWILVAGFPMASQPSK